MKLFLIAALTLLALSWMIFSTVCFSRDVEDAYRSIRQTNEVFLSESYQLSRSTYTNRSSKSVYDSMTARESRPEVFMIDLVGQDVELPRTVIGFMDE